MSKYFFLFLLLISVFSVKAQISYDCVAANAVSGLHIPDCEALVALYNATDGSNWTFGDVWLFGDDPCVWMGVVCDGGVTIRRVIELQLDNANMNGQLPSEIGSLTALIEFRLTNNKLKGFIPPEIGSLTSLQALFIDTNMFNSPLPPEIGDLTNLTYFYGMSAGLTGKIPGRIGNLVNLAGLNLSNNGLTGTIPARIIELTNLSALNLSNNNLTGEIPLAIGSLPLQTLDLSHNQLTGEIPFSITQMPLLRYLYLNNNQISGEVPAELGSMSGLFSLIISDNKLTEQFPPFINGSALEILNLNNNNLTGDINQFTNLGQLVNLQLENNHFGGTFPTSTDWGNWSLLQVLNIGGNKITGDVPVAVTQLTVGNVYYNGLYATDPGARTHLTSLNPGWEATQTVIPTAIGLNYDEGTGVLTASWTPLSLGTTDTSNAVGGYYQVDCGLAGQGTFDLMKARTLNKDETFLTFFGIPANDYECRVKTTIMPHPKNRNTVTSENSTTLPVTVTPFGGAVGNNNLETPAEVTGESYQYTLYDVSLLSPGAREPRLAPPLPPSECSPDLNYESAPTLFFHIAADTPRGAPGHFVFGSVIVAAGAPGHFVFGSSENELDTMISIFEENGVDDYTFVTCSDNAHPLTVGSSLIFNREAGKNYLIVVWFKNTDAQNFTFVAGEASPILNNQFEIDADGDKIPDAWKTTNADGVKIRCVIGFAYTQFCGVKISGGTRFFHNIRPELAETWQSGDQIQIAAFIRRKKLPVNAQMRLKIVYDDPSLATTTIITPLAPGNSSNFELYTSDADPLTEGSQSYTLLGTVKKVRVEFRYNGATGHIRIDDVYLNYVANGGRDVHWIPLPPAP